MGGGAGRGPDVSMGEAMKTSHPSSAPSGAPWSTVLGFLLSVAVRGDFQGSTHLVELETDAIKYSKETTTGPVAELIRKIESGKATLEWDAKLGWLPSFQKALGVPAASQTLVFSKTSLQREHIHPGNPRAIFFNDDVYLGYIPGAPVVEVSEVDPRLGGVFYVVEQKPTDKPVIKRIDNCLECHASSRTMGVPGHLFRSVQTDRQGIVDLATGIEPVDHRTPFADRWGGWYVTGTHGPVPHRGNRMGDDFAKAKSNPSIGGNKTRLDDYFDPTRYPARGSDIVALMVLGHQVHLHNFIARVHYMAAQHLAAYGHVDYLKSPVEGLVQHLLFAGEVPLAHPVQGDPEFVRGFEAAGPRDRKGRSLRQLDLQRHLFRHPCSFLIHSEAFRRLPAPLKQKIYRRMAEVLSGADLSEPFRRLSSADREAVRDILTETLEDLPPDWKRLVEPKAVPATGPTTDLPGTTPPGAPLSDGPK